MGLVIPSELGWIEFLSMMHPSKNSIIEGVACCRTKVKTESFVWAKIFIKAFASSSEKFVSALLVLSYNCFNNCLNDEISWSGNVFV